MKRILQLLVVFMLMIPLHSALGSTPSGCSDAGVADATNDSICDGGNTTLTLTAYVGAIQWQSFDGSLWINETGAGATTDNYNVTLLVTTDFRAVVTDVGCPPDTSNTVTIFVGVTPPTGTGDTRCGYGPVTLSASGGPIIKWYDVASGGTSLFTGSSYTTNVGATTTFYAGAATSGGGANVAPMPPQTSQYNANQTRGYWFQAPVNFTITGLDVPVTGLATPQSIAVLLMAGPPAVFTNYTCTFTTLFLTQNNPVPGTFAYELLHVPVGPAERQPRIPI